MTDQDDYFKDIYNGVLATVLSGGKPETDRSAGMIDLLLATDALCAVLATFASQSGNYPTRRAKRKVAEEYRKKVLW